MWFEITYLFPNFTGATAVSLGSLVKHIKYFHPMIYWACEYLSMPGLRLLKGPLVSCVVKCLQLINDLLPVD